MAEFDSSLGVICPICGAGRREKCEMNSGTPRFESHLERRELARDRQLMRQPHAKPFLIKKPAKP